SGGAAKVGIQKGREALKKQTGLNAVDFSMVEAANKDERKAFGNTIQRHVAVSRLNEIMSQFGDETILRAKDALQTGSPLLNKPIREIKLETVGDPKLRRFLIALNGFDRQYTSLTSGGSLSNAQLPVSTQQEVKKIIDPNMTLPEVIAAVEQVKTEGKRED